MNSGAARWARINGALPSSPCSKGKGVLLVVWVCTGAVNGNARLRRAVGRRNQPAELKGLISRGLKDQEVDHSVSPIRDGDSSNPD